MAEVVQLLLGMVYVTTQETVSLRHGTSDYRDFNCYLSGGVSKMNIKEFQQMGRFKRFLVRLGVAVGSYNEMKRNGRPVPFKLCWHEAGFFLFVTLARESFKETLAEMQKSTEVK